MEDRRPLRLGFPARLRFASGDFACNLYWQGLSLFLLFFYTDVAGLPIAAATLVYMAGTIWGGIADLAVGLLADRPRKAARGYRRYLSLGAVPLGLAFVLLFAPLPRGVAGVLLALAAQLLFRSLYALVNVPYSALTARITEDSRDRSSIAGLRMLFGTLAAIAVALGAQPFAAAIAGPHRAWGYAAAAAIAALAASAILVPLGRSLRERLPTAPARSSAAWGPTAARLLANRAFTTLIAAIVCADIGLTMLDRVILCYFKYALGSEPAGRAALADMSVAAAIAIPLWMAAARRLGGRAVWLLAAGLGIAALACYGLASGGGALATQAMLTVFQVGAIGVNLAFWALLPDTVEYGEAAAGQRIEASAFGLASLTQKIALGAGAGLFGLLLGAADYRANIAQAPAALATMRAILIVAPIAGLSLSALAIAFNPLRRGTHDRLVAALRETEPVG